MTLARLGGASARVALSCVLMACVSLAAEGQTAQPAAAVPAALDRRVDFAADVKPILEAKCVRCHARGRDRGGFSIETRERLLVGGDSGPAIAPGNSGDSRLIALVAGLDPDMVMPRKGSRLTRDQIAVLRAWIDQGAAWDPSITFAKAAPRNLVPRRPELPPASSAARNPIDRLLQPYFAGHHVEPGPIVGDRQFARRVYLDVIGVLPTPGELQAFLAQRAPDKRARLVARLLADDRRYAEHWLTFWNDLLRNDYRGTGYIDGGRLQISAWLYAALASNMPYDRFVASLVNPVAGAEGFTRGIVWRGVVNASQTPEMQAAQNVSQVFMGVNLKCASCHDSFINDLQLSDSYGLAGVFAQGPLEMVECDRPTGRTAPMKLLYQALGTIDARRPREERIQRLAEALLSPANGRLARTLVNRLWARLMGRGLVEPVDDMEQPAWNPDVLDWLAEDFVAHGFDVKATIARIVTSKAYQRTAIDLAERPGEYVFLGPAVRRMTAEQFDDGLGAVTGVWRDAPAGAFDFHLMSAHAAPDPARTRAALVPADPLMTALGRPNREQVVTTRASVPTTLQMLELSNGATLAERLRRGAAQLAASGERDPSALVTTVFLRALSRPPTAAERALGVEILGAAATAERLEDLLWSIVMLPEFQLIG